MGEQHELLRRRTSHDSAASSQDSYEGSYEPSSPKTSFLSSSLWRLLRRPVRRGRVFYTKLHRQPGRRGMLLRCLSWTLAALVISIIILITFTAAFRPSYTHPPDHYRTLQKRCEASREPGRGNMNDEKVYIAATLYDPNGKLVQGDWGNAVVQLVELLGPQNVHLSLYENDVSTEAKAALKSMKDKVQCNTSLISDHLSHQDVYSVTTPSGEKRTKRIAFLAEARNRALRPLDAESVDQFDKLLYINDVIFNPIDAVNLLFSTNLQPSGHADYRAACATDFINAFKFYDRFATRDNEGYTTGIPFFPWFTDAGRAESRQDVLNQKDAIRVRSCWGGMTAFEAKWFQDRTLPSIPPDHLNESNHLDLEIAPLRFRYDKDPFWDASECCLIHADLAYLSQGGDTIRDPGIFMNPYIRVAYDVRTLGWLPYTRRVERLYSFIHTLLNHLVGMPEYNPRRLDHPGSEVIDKVWNYEEAKLKGGNGHYHDVKRIAEPGRFCGARKLLVLRDDPKPGEKSWENVELPKVAN